MERHRTTKDAVNKRPCLCVTKHYFSTSLAFTSFSKGGTYGMHQLSNYCVYMEMTQLVPLVCDISWACQTCTYTDKYLFTIVGYYKHLYIERETVVSWHLVIIMWHTCTNLIAVGLYHTVLCKITYQYASTMRKTIDCKYKHFLGLFSFSK